MNTPSIIEGFYNQSKNTPSDIYQHIETLCNYSKDAESVLECGVRNAISTWGFAHGLLNNGKDVKKLTSVDLVRSNIFDIYEPLLKQVLDFSFWAGNDLDFFPEDTKYDIIFIDTWHVYGQLKRELKKFAPICNKWIIMHDTTVDEIFGETIRCGLNAAQQSIETGIPVEEICKGLWPAVVEFLQENGTEFRLKERFTHCNGLTILERIQ